MVDSSVEWGNTFRIRHDGKVWCVSGHKSKSRLPIRSRMQVASSDATNIRTSIRREGDEIVINGLKWFVSSSSAMCQLSKCHAALQVHQRCR